MTALLLHLALGLGLLAFGRAMLLAQLRAVGVRHLTWRVALSAPAWPEERIASAIAALGLGAAGLLVLASALTAS
jgi:hypothetical protein